ncbi:MAG: GNAT family N-acetyltransferase [Dehalococcoidales bacterium]
MSDSHYIVRNYRPADFEDYVKLNIEVEKLEPTGRCLSPQALSENLGWPNYSPLQDMFVAAIAGKIVGFINVTPELITKRVLIDCLVHPKHRHRGLAKKLLAYALRRAGELKVKVAHVNIRQDNAVAKQVLSRLSFRVVRQFLELRLPLAEVHLPEVTHPNYTSRHLQPGEEDKLAQIQNRCFADTWGYNPNTPEEIVYSLSLSHCSPQNVILIHEGDKLVAYCWTRIDCATEAANSEKKGRIFMLGVDPDYRGRGIGKVALLAGLAYFKNNGIQVVELTVDSENRAACALYRSAGFKIWTCSLYYEKTVE